MQWPEKAFCDTARSFFDCSLLNHLQTRKLGRMIKNDAAVAAGLKAKLSNRGGGGGGGAAFANRARVEVRDVDFSTLSFEEQLLVDVTTDVMIGPHGAGLMHNVFMPDRAALMELFVDGSSANRHFHNLAFWAGHGYSGESQANPVAVDRLVASARATVERLDLTRPPW